ncbi:MAG: hypothetical protein CMC13_12910 [Flavobacteriaceae bacterium]|nr:hypothetical protein [Flavobacteriaceae bacterium]|tara:strand:+ start:2699 stop:4711 length:2013 start_codon:yes stop_codon:yes gene_type:complete
MKRTKILCLLFCLCYITAFAQYDGQDISVIKQKIAATKNGDRLVWMDSLTQLTKFDHNSIYDSIANATLAYAIEIDSMSVAAMNIGDLMYFYSAYLSDFEKAFAIYNQYKPIFKDIAPTDVTRLYLNSSNVFQDVGNYKMAVKLLDSVTKYARITNNNYHSGLAKMYRAQISASLGENAKASIIYRDVIKVFEEEKDTFNILATMNSLSILYSQNNFFEEAHKIQKEAEFLATKANEDGFLASIYSNMATDLGKQDRLAESIKYLKLAVASILKTDYHNRYAPPIYLELLKKYAKVDSLEKAEEVIQKLQEYDEFMTEGPNLRSYNSGMKHYYLAKGDYKKALELGLLTLGDKNVDFHAEEDIDNEAFMVDVYKKLGDTELELYHLKRFQKLNDSINSVKKVNALSYYQTLYETEKRDAQIENQENKLALLEEKHKTKNQWITFGAISLVGIFGFILVVRSRNNQKKQKIIESNFSQKLLLAQETERTRVAKDLHDSVGQRLSIMHRKAENLDQADLAAMTAGTLEEVRSISRGLYPPMLEKLGLTKSLQHLLLEIDEETAMFVSTEIDNIDSFFNEEETLNFYRFVQESITNVIKHANAKTLLVKITSEEKKITAIIKDNGHGFEDTEHTIYNSLGLKTMSERIKLLKGKISINSTKNEGTMIKASISK